MQRGNTALHIAALAGHLAVVKLLVERKCDINSKAQGSFTPLYMAAQENHIDVLKYLLSKGADETITTEVSLLPTNHPRSDISHPHRVSWSSIRLKKDLFQRNYK